MSDIHVLKFGGTSLQNPAFIQQAAEVVRERAKTVRPVVVVSAIGGVTDRLVELTDGLWNQPEAAAESIEDLRNMHHEVLRRLTNDSYDQVEHQLDVLFDELNLVYFNKKMHVENARAWRDHVLSFGERASACIFAATLSHRKLAARALEAQHLIKTDANFGEANVISNLTRELVAEAIRPLREVAVITGFIGSTEKQEITTLGRSGSDYTAGLVADALNAGHLEIWTDVDGVLTADPKIVPTAHHIDKLSYDDIAELSAHGAKVIHPKTIRPIRRSDTSVLVRNSYNPTHPGTLIDRSFHSNGAFRSVTVSGPFTYFEIDHPDAHELSLQLQEQLDRSGDSEAFSFSKSSRYEPAHFLVRESLFYQIEESIENWLMEVGIGAIYPRHGLFKVKKFTNRLNQSDEPLIQILKILSRKGIRPLRIHREHSQRYVSLLLPKDEAYTTARLINDYLIDDRTTVDVFIAGRGAVGGTLLQLLDELSLEQVRLRVVGICDSKRVNWHAAGIDLLSANKLAEGQPTDWPAIVYELTSSHRDHTIFVDATGSEEVARLYPALLNAGIHIATPSKRANTLEQSFYDSIHSLTRTTGTSYRYETTVGAGLPVISTLTDMLESGDRITKITGVLSGTMTYLFDELENGTRFSDAVVQARDLGYAEPDPRDDLSGEDVARKFLTLARTIGLKIERNQIAVESLIPEHLRDVDRDSFLARLPEVDGLWEDRLRKAGELGKTLRYIGTLEDGKISIGVREIPLNAPLGQLSGTGNMIYIYSQRYRENPIIIQGPGAGKLVTAAGLLSDILKIVHEI
jgi:aspartokinase/homoserine dehydrogenase 1